MQDDGRPPALQEPPTGNPHMPRKDSHLCIQYRGFSVEETSRIYAYHVVEQLKETRHFTVDVQTRALHSSPLKIQDGPGMCYARLKQELDHETEEFPAEAHLHITPGDIQEYVERTYPKPVKKWATGARP